MRTTLDIDEDALAATKENAKRQRKLASELMREALQLPAGQILPKSSGRHGFSAHPLWPGTRQQRTRQQNAG